MIEKELKNVLQELEAREHHGRTFITIAEATCLKGVELGLLKNTSSNCMPVFRLTDKGRLVLSTLEAEGSLEPETKP